MVDKVMSSGETPVVREITEPGVIIAGSLSEVFGFKITDDAMDEYRKNMEAIDENERRASAIGRTIFIHR